MSKGKPTVIDLFAGAGLFGHSFEIEGFKVTHAVEIEAAAAKTHVANMECPVQVADITTIAPSGRCDVLIAGPPCQGFSTLGKQREHDPRNFSGLEVARWAKCLKPKLIVIENVAAFLAAPAHLQLRERLTSLGYEVETTTLNAVDFGVPQHRRRSFTFATKIGIPTVTKLRGDYPATVRAAWKGLSKKPDGLNSHTAPKPSALAYSRMLVIPPGGDKRDVMRELPKQSPPSWWRTHSEITDVWGRLEWDQPSNTLRTCLLNPSKGRYIHPDQHRVMSIREAARLHSIPDDWSFVGTPYQVVRQIGNSVPVNLGRAVARSVLRCIGG